MGYRTSRMVLHRGGKHRALFAVLRENMRHAKAVYNTTLFYIRNLFTGLNKEPNIRTENEQTVILNVITAIDSVNEMRLTKGREPYVYPTPESPYLSDYLWMSVMGRILKRDLPRPQTFYSKLEQQVIRSACRAMKSFFSASAAYRKHPGNFTGRPRLPRYLKQDTFTLDYDKQMVKTQGNGRRHTIKLAALEPCLQTGRKVFTDIVSIRFAYRHGEIIASICTEYDDVQNLMHFLGGGAEVSHSACSSDSKTPEADCVPMPDPSRVIGIDPGVKNFLTVCPGFGSRPFIIRGGKLKSVNQYFNKRRAAIQSRLKKECGRYDCRALDRLSGARENFIYNYFHQTACLIVNYALHERAGTIVVGRNVGWKQNVSMSKQQNQKFVSIPFHRFFRILEDKAAGNGIQVVFVKESYTSMASAADRDPIPEYTMDKHVTADAFSGRRVQRGLYRSADGRTLNADVNGAANIIRVYSEDALQEDLGYLYGTVEIIHAA